MFRATNERTPRGYYTKLPELGGSLVCPHENGAYSATETVVDKNGKLRKKKLGPPDCFSCRYCLHKTACSAATGVCGIERTQWVA